MASAGILGMFVGATLLALGYQIFMGWVASNPEGAGPTDRDDKAVCIQPPRLPGQDRGNGRRLRQRDA